MELSFAGVSPTALAQRDRKAWAWIENTFEAFQDEWNRDDPERSGP